MRTLLMAIALVVARERPGACWKAAKKCWDFRDWSKCYQVARWSDGASREKVEVVQLVLPKSEK